MADYIDMEHTCNGLRYVLMLVDKFGRLVEFIAAAPDSPTAITATRSILTWASRYGLPDWVISDGGSHFKNRTMDLMAQHMGLDHHVTLAYYCPWANGAVEIVRRELLCKMRALLSELGFSATDWDLMLPVVQYALNYREREVLDGRQNPN